MINITKITRLTLFLFVASLFFSCEKESSENSLFKESNRTPMSFQDLKDSLSKEKIVSKNQNTSDTSTTWASTDGSYYEKLGDTVHFHPTSGIIQSYKINFEGANFTYLVNSTTGVNIALPKWDAGNLRFSYRYSFEEGRWLTDKQVRYSVLDNDENFSVYFSNVDPGRIRFGWYIDTPDTYDDYRHDIFLNGEKIEENHTFGARLNYFNINNLSEETNYDIKIIAKDQGNNGILRIHRFSVKTAKRILISDFDIKVSSVASNKVVMSWTIPDVLNSTSQIKHFSLGFGSNRLGAFMGNTVGIDTEVIIEFITDGQGNITGFVSPETLGHGSSTPGYSYNFSTPMPISTALNMYVTVVVPSNNPEEPNYTEYKRLFADAPIVLVP